MSAYACRISMPCDEITVAADHAIHFCLRRKFRGILADKPSGLVVGSLAHVQESAGRRFLQDRRRGNAAVEHQYTKACRDQWMRGMHTCGSTANDYDGKFRRHGGG